MPMAGVVLRPGVNVEKTLSANEAGIARSQLVRFKDGMTQSMGGWQLFTNATVPSTVRDLHAWQGLTNERYLALGATQNLAIATLASYADITPETWVTNPTPNISISSANNIVTIADPNSAVGAYTSVVFETPLSIGNLIFQSAYPVYQVLSSGSFTIQSSIIPSTTIASSGQLAIFNSVLNSPLMTVTQPNHGWSDIFGILVNYIPPTSISGLTIQGQYALNSVIDSTTFTFTFPAVSTANGTATLNNGLAQLRYYDAGGPSVVGSGFGLGAYGDGGFGIGAGTAAAPAGVNIVSSDWSTDNWGEILLACQKDGPIFQWSPDSAFLRASLVTQCPLVSGGIFVSMPLQILVAWASIQNHGHGVEHGTQDPLTVNWSDQLDYTNWEVSNQTTAGSFHFPTGSKIIGGMQAPNYGVIWTDIDVWVMQYVGGELIFNFTRVGSGCGLVGQHAAGVLANEVYWCGYSNFFKLSGGGVETLPCTVWDFVFQNINRSAIDKVRCAPNSVFNEITWFFPSGTNTENDSYAKVNIIEGTWDYGLLERTAWVDVSVLGPPIGTDTGGFIWQHESGNAISGAGNPSFATGWWTISEGEELAFVDYIIPDFIWGTFGTNAASIDLTFFSADYPGDTPQSYGPYTVTQQTKFLTPRIRGRLMSMEVKGNVSNQFWRTGKIRYRWAPSGRR